MTLARDIARTIILLVVGIFGGLNAVDALVHKWHMQAEAKQVRISLQHLMDLSDGPEDMANQFRKFGCPITHLSRNRVLVKLDNGNTILITEDFAAINPSDDLFNIP